MSTAQIDTTPIRILTVTKIKFNSAEIAEMHEDMDNHPFNSKWLRLHSGNVLYEYVVSERLFVRVECNRSFHDPRLNDTLFKIWKHKESEILDILKFKFEL